MIRSTMMRFSLSLLLLALATGLLLGMRYLSQAQSVTEIDPTQLFAPTSRSEGWSCGDFPCEDDLDGWQQRITVPPGFAVSFEGSFPGIVQQITTLADGRIAATVWEDGLSQGAVYVLNEDGSTGRATPTLYSPIGIAVQDESGIGYVSGRFTPNADGALWRIWPDGRIEAVFTALPCCADIIGNQPNGLTFGPDGMLYLGIGARSNDGLGPDGDFLPSIPDEAAILRVNPATDSVEVYASGIRNPFDMAFSTSGRLYATDNGLVSGPGDRLLRVEPGRFYGFPYYRTRGCEKCPAKPNSLEVAPDYVRFPDYTLPRGLTVYDGDQFPANLRNTLFVALWNGTPWAQQIAWIDPQRVAGPDAEAAQPFMRGLVRPTDVVTAPDGSLLVADSVYGHIWRVTYIGEVATPLQSSGFQLPTATLAPINSLPDATPALPSLFATNTPTP